jgi:signal transduction histidine kinase
VSGKITLKRERVELNALVSRCLQSLIARINARRQESMFVPAPDSVVVDADPVRLEQVVCNLIDNAIKYTPPEGKIRVSVERSGEEAIVRVRDTGMGIAPELMPRVFDMFAQAEGSLDRTQGGLGLGLTLVRRLIEQHGGSVAARSAGTNEGSEFVVSLPIAPAMEAAPEPAPPPAVRDAESVGPPVTSSSSRTTSTGARRCARSSSSAGIGSTSRRTARAASTPRAGWRPTSR